MGSTLLTVKLFFFFLLISTFPPSMTIFMNGVLKLSNNFIFFLMYDLLLYANVHSGLHLKRGMKLLNYYAHLG